LPGYVILCYAALSQAGALGLKDADRLVLLAQHPISSATDAELVARADALYPQLVRAITTDGPPDAALRRRLRSGKGPEGECAAGG
jgi:hypothetical protein